MKLSLKPPIESIDELTKFPLIEGVTNAVKLASFEQLQASFGNSNSGSIGRDFQSQVLLDMPELFTDFDLEGDGRISDVSGFGSHGTGVGSYTIGGSILPFAPNSKSLVCDGATGKIRFNAEAIPASNTARVTLMGWAVASASAKGMMLSLGGNESGTSGEGIAIGYGGANIDQPGLVPCAFSQGVAYVNGSNTVSPGLHHLALTVSEREWRIYVDGKLFHFQTSDVLATQGRGHIGGYSNRTSNFGIAYPAYYSSALPHSRIKAHYLATKATL
uniref:hypothetical protein n=1 Tax=Trichocoleus desertorum TaxID=1481672 RepID=UPI0025B6070B|nr:hypothetical protein [Trichocoleus desertorum]